MIKTHRFSAFANWINIYECAGGFGRSRSKNAIDTFFEGFHARDSIMMKSVLADDVVIRSIGRDKSGEISLQGKMFIKC